MPNKSSVGNFLVMAGMLFISANAAAVLRPGLSKVVGQTEYRVGVQPGVATPISEEELADWPSWATAVAYKWKPEWPKNLQSAIPAKGRVVIEDEVVFVDPDTKAECKLPVTEIDASYMHTYPTDSVPTPGDGTLQTNIRNLGRQYWAIIDKFKLGANINVIRPDVFANCLVFDTCAVIPATVDTIRERAFANTQFLNALQFEYSATPLVFEDRHAVQIDVAPLDSIEALINSTSFVYMYKGSKFCRAAYQFQGDYCSSVFYSGIPINQITLVNPVALAMADHDDTGSLLCRMHHILDVTGRGENQGPVTVAPCIGTLIMERDWILNLYDPETGARIDKPSFSTPFGPFGIGTTYIGETINKLCDNFFFRLGNRIIGSGLILPPAPDPIDLGTLTYPKEIWLSYENIDTNTGKQPFTVPNVYIGRKVVPTNMFQASYIYSVWYSLCPKPEVTSVESWSPYPLRFWNWDTSQLGEQHKFE